MRGLLLFLANNSSTFLFFFLEAICFYVIVRFNDSQERVWQNTATVVTGYFHKKVDDIDNYFSLDDQIIALQQENAFLRKKLQTMARIQGDSILSDTALSGVFAYLPKDTTNKDTLRDEFTFIPVGIIDNSVAGSDNVLILNRGKLDGIEPHMGVISGDGVVGIVREISNHYSTVMSLLHRQTRVSASIQGSGAFGVLRWYPHNTKHMKLEGVPQHETVVKGDTVVTTGYPLSNIFPKGLVIGTVENAYIERGENFYTIDVKLKINLSRIQHAYVVSLNHRNELLELQQQMSK